jgi:lauroyl/myristoyl acyltransferase
VPLIASEGCFPVVTELLRRGAVVVMAFDWPGSVESRFLGKPVRLAAGTARLAEVSGALVVPVMRDFRQLRLRTTFGAPLGAAPGGWRQLHDAVAAHHERWILECPAALEDPRRAGAWEEAATAESWGLPLRLRQPS